MSNPLAEGGMRFTFPPYGKKYGPASLHNIYIKKSPDANSLLFLENYKPPENSPYPITY
jgi:hypothetical protein